MFNVIGHVAIGFKFTFMFVEPLYEAPLSLTNICLVAVRACKFVCFASRVSDPPRSYTDHSQKQPQRDEGSGIQLSQALTKILKATYPRTGPSCFLFLFLIIYGYIFYVLLRGSPTHPI